jgi:ABC-2 type transport system ATP-binding protein
MSVGEPAIHTLDLTHAYGPRVAIHRVSLSVPEGSIFGFLGPNGAGKTTTIRVLLGFLRARQGEARVLGQSCWQQSRAIKHDVGYVPGDLRLWPWLTGHSALRLIGRVRGVDIRDRGATLARRLGLDLSLRVDRMSKGTRQKLGLVLAMAHEPKLLILDEPSSGLDPLVQDEFRAILREAASAGRTVFLSSHTLGEVEDLCDRVAIVRQGSIVANDTLANLRARAGLAVVVHFEPGHEPAQAELPVTLTPDPPPPGTHPKPGLWHATFRGEPRELLAFLAGRRVLDVTIARPDLESMFRGYYQATTSTEARP